MIDVVANYETIWFEGHFQYILMSDVVHVRGSWFLHADFSATIPLVALQPRVEGLRVRSRHFWVGFYTALLGFGGSLILVRGFNVDPLDVAPGLLGIFGLSGLLTALITVRKTEYAQFLTDAGVPALVIARTRRGSGNFTLFVQKVLDQIRSCKGSA